ncbi:hypothetical protein MCAP1_001344 [Malassezia caprae]|uniref:Uncharacterized protein n=1 Tax=Malassezia caprae TaxID=1381934 RepID=A0AAF0E430_9BASI|nr:hypothetical protein MCAP1_001344 [Malassezia caprae]
MVVPTGDVRQWTTTGVGEWLRKLGLEQYVPSFVENDIDGEALIVMDEASLRDLGLAPLGHRHTLLTELFHLKQMQGIPIEKEDWVPSGTWTPLTAGQNSMDDSMSQQLYSRDQRIQWLEARVAQLSATMAHLHEDMVALARATGHTDAVHAPFDYGGSSQTRQAAPPITQEGWFHPDRSPLWAPEESPRTARAQPTANTAHMAPLCDAVVALLQRRGIAQQNATGRLDATVSSEDPCMVLLPAVFQLYQVQDDWRNYVLFATYGSTERCISYDERPLVVLYRMRESMPDTGLQLRPVSELESPWMIAQRKLAVKWHSGVWNNPQKHDALHLRAARTAKEEVAGLFSVHAFERLRPSALTPDTRVRGPIATLPDEPVSYAVAIYPYESDREDEFDVQAGDTFVVLSKAKGWWALRRDSGADGRGDVYLASSNAVPEIWTGWVPAGCLLEIKRPLAQMVEAPLTLTDQAWLTHMIEAPIPVDVVVSQGTAAVALMDFESKDHAFRVAAQEPVRVFKRYNFWSYCIAEGPRAQRGWMPSWLISRRSSRSANGSVRASPSTQLLTPAPPAALSSMGPPAVTLSYSATS